MQVRLRGRCDRFNDNDRYRWPVTTEIMRDIRLGSIRGQVGSGYQIGSAMSPGGGRGGGGSGSDQLEESVMSAQQEGGGAMPALFGTNSVHFA